MRNAKSLKQKSTLFAHFKSVQSSAPLTQRACSRYTELFNVECVEKNTAACVEEIKL